MDQYGIRNRHSTAQAVTDFIIDNIKARENNEHTLVTYLDLSKAFDMIDQKILINKFEYYGVRGQSISRDSRNIFFFFQLRHCKC